MVRILLADDHTILRHGISKSVQQRDDMEIVGQASDGLTAVKLARELTPEVILMDVGMPDMNGIEATREIMRELPQTKIIALSMHSSKKFVGEMLKAGAVGYLLKDCTFDEIVLAIETVMGEKTYLTPSVADTVVDSFVRAPEHEETSVFARLTPREREVLQLTAEGNTTKQVALKLHISPKTVEAHRLRVMNKLDIDNVAQLTKYAIQEGLTSSEP
jgi:DNA-binding NarL/FixJ family response regulator